MKVLVLGAGPSGLVAAHIAALQDHDVLIYSRPGKSPLYGCQYLHEPILMATQAPPVSVEYRLEGTPEGYGLRVYGGRAPHVRVSPVDLVGLHQAWDIRQTYDWLWDTYGSYVQPLNLENYPLELLQKNLAPDLTLSTVPAKLLCRNASHTFSYEEVWAMGDAPDLGQRVPVSCPPNTVICNGNPLDDGPTWYRISNVFDHSTVEWPGYLKKPPINGVTRVRKPLTTSCDCPSRFPVPTFRVGRYGLWMKGVLVNHVVGQTLEAMREVLYTAGRLF